MTSEPLIRCFFALPLPPAITTYLATIVEELRLHGADIRWVPEANMHVTLRFLGEIDQKRFEELRAGEAPGEGYHAATVSARGLGAFPSLRAPRLLWAGLAGATQSDRDALQRLQELSERRAREAGLVPELRRWSPHITLGRVGRPGDGLRELMDDITRRECASQEVVIDRMVMMRSRLGSDGAHYEVVREFPLQS